MSNRRGSAGGWADRVANETGRPRFVAEAIGPLTVFSFELARRR